MAVFSDLHTADGLKTLEAHLAGKTYVSGDAITKDDIKVFAAVPLKPGAEFPNAARWYETISAAVASRFPGKAVGVNLPAGSAPAAAAPAAEAEDDDDLDLFGDETEEDKKAADERAAAKASSKKKESGKSSVFMDVKPWDDETDMKKLEEAVRSVQMEGLTWGAFTNNEDSEGLSKRERELKDLKDQFREDFPVGPLIGKCCTMDQGKAVINFLDSILDKSLRSTVALLAARGRGKSAALGLAIAGAVAAGYSNIFVTAPSPENLKTLFDFVCKGINALEYKEHLHYDVVKRMIQMPAVHHQPGTVRAAPAPITC
jgi:elongation factor 1-beta